MVCYAAGSNIFGQWSWTDIISNEFRIIQNNDDNLPTNILQINWSYNLLKIGHNYVISGFWNGNENQQIDVPLPHEVTKSNIKYDDLIIAGNDYYLLLARKNSSAVWIKDLKKEEDYKKINIVEEAVDNTKKRQRLDKSIKKVALVNDSCLYLTVEGSVYNGILPTHVDTRHCSGRIINIYCGYEHYVLLTDMGAVYTWGNGRRLQLGHGEVSNLEEPTEVEALAGIKITKIACGGWHTLALSEFGDLYAWGWNYDGQLGIKQKIDDNESYSIPTLVDLFDGNGQDVALSVKDIACGSKHSAILVEDNTVWTTGCNKYGQLGFSEEKYPKIINFSKAFQCKSNSNSLICGPWTTVIVSN